METSSSSTHLPSLRLGEIPDPKKAKEGLETVTSQTELSTLQRTGAAFATGLKALRTAASAFTFTPSVVKESAKGVKKSAKEAWSGERKTKTRWYKYKIKDPKTTETLRAKREDAETRQAVYDYLGSGPTIDDAKEIAKNYASKRLEDLDKEFDDHNGIDDLLEEELKELERKYGTLLNIPEEQCGRIYRRQKEIEERKKLIEAKKARLNAAIEKIDVAVTTGIFKGAREIKRAKEGLKEIDNQVRLDAEKSLREYNSLSTKTYWEERQKRWEPGGLSNEARAAYAKGSKKFDPYVRDSIRNYVENVSGIREQLREDSGHLYLVVPEKGGMIFIPNREMEKITFIRFKEGNKIVKDANRLKRYARIHMAAYDTIEEGLGEWLKDHPELQREYFTTYSYNLHTNMAYVQGPLDPNKAASKQPRKNFKLGTGVWKTIHEIMDPNKTKNPDKLDTPLAYKHSRAEGEREERLARIEAEKTKLQKELATAKGEEKAAIQDRIHKLNTEKLSIARASEEKTRDDRINSLSDLPAKKPKKSGKEEAS